MKRGGKEGKQQCPHIGVTSINNTKPFPEKRNGTRSCRRS